LIVGPDGKTSEVSMLRSSGFPLLDQAAMDAVRKWRFNTHEAGYARLELPVTFKLDNR
jgi:protein TonB